MRKIFYLSLFIFIILSSLYVSPSKTLSNTDIKTRYRKFYIYNPFPYPLEEIFLLNLSFNKGTAYNSSIVILDENNNELEYQLLNISFYPGTEYIANCSLIFYTHLNPFSINTYIVKYTSNKPIETNNQYIYQNGIVRINNYSLINITTDYYNITIGNQSNPGIWIEGIKINGKWFNFTDKPRIDWSIVLRNFTVIGPEQFNYTTKVIYNGSILSVISINALWNTTRIRIIAEFSKYLPYINLKYSIYTTNKIKTVYLPRYRIPLSYNQLIFPGLKTYNGLYTSLLSIYPAYSLFGFSNNLQTVFTGLVNVFDGKMDDLLMEFNNTEINTTLTSYSEIKRIQNMKKIALTLYNLTSHQKVEKQGISEVLKELGFLKKNKNILIQLLEKNITRNILYINNTYIVKRLIGERWSNTFFLGYQLNMTTLADKENSFKGFIILNSDLKKTFSHIYMSILNTSLIIPLQYSVSTISKEKAELDTIYNLTLLINTYENVTNLNLTLKLPEDTFQLVKSNLTVTLWNLTSQRIYNYTWKLIPRKIGFYLLNISAISNRGTINLTIGVNVSSPPIFQPPKELKKYNLTVFVKRINLKPLPGRVVRIFDPSQNKTIMTGVTDSNGSVSFYNLIEGVYIVEVQEFNLLNNYTVSLFSNRVYEILMNLTDLTIHVTSPSGESIPGVIIRILDNEGNLVYSSITNTTGDAVFKSIPLNTYTASLQFSNNIVSSLKINLSKTNNVTTTIGVYRLRIKVVREKNKPLALATVNIERSNTQYSYFAITNMTNLNGECTFYLIKDRYKITISRAQYHYEKEINLESDTNLVLKVSRGNTLWIITLATALLWLSFGFYWYRSTSEIKREENKYLQLLRRLEDYYNRGLIEEKYYIRLKEEYEEKIKKLKGE